VFAGHESKVQIQQVWNEEDSEDEVLAMVVRTGLRYIAAALQALFSTECADHPCSNSVGTMFNLELFATSVHKHAVLFPLHVLCLPRHLLELFSNTVTKQTLSART